MGEVVQMDAFRRRRVDSASALKWEMNLDPLIDVRLQISNLWRQAVELDSSVRSLPTVQQREQAVIRAMEFRQEAYKLADKHGLEIKKG